MGTQNANSASNGASKVVGSLRRRSRDIRATRTGYSYVLPLTQRDTFTKNYTHVLEKYKARTRENVWAPKEGKIQ